jgi:hypothetical protein
MGWREGLFGNEAGEGPQWGWVNKLDGFFDLLRHPEQDDQTEIENAIFHNEARGDADAIPDAWYRAAEAGIETFDEAEKGGWL